MTTTEQMPTFFGNERALQIFLDSGLPDTFEWRHAVAAEALHIQNHIDDRYSACVASACGALSLDPPMPASGIAADYLRKAGAL